MKKRNIYILISILCVITILASFLVVYFLNKKNSSNPPNTSLSGSMERIGIGGGGAFFNPMIDPTNENIYYVTSDMGALYYSYNKGETWSRTEARGVFNQTHIANNGTVFAGGYGLYASYDKGKTLNLIYPKNVKHYVSRCGWNENLMLAEGYDNGYLKCVTTSSNTLYFATIDWTGNFRLMKSDFFGDDLQILSTEKLDISNPVSDIDMFMTISNNGLYISFGTKICFYNFSNQTITNVYTAQGYIKDLCVIDGQIFFIDDTSDKSLILYTSDFINFSDLLDFNTLDTSFTKYGKDGTFNWHFKEFSGNNFNNIFLSFSSPVNEFDDTVDGIMKFNGTNFEWVFDSMFKNHSTVDCGGWSYGCHGPFYGIFASSHSNNVCLVSNIESVYFMNYETDETKQIKRLHCISNNDGTYSTNGLDVQTTYFVKEDPFDINHIIICTTDLGLQNSFDGGKTWQRMTITGEDYDIYNTCYDLYFDPYNKNNIYALWSSIHDAPYNPTTYYKDYTKGAFAVSNDGGVTWDFSYSTGINQDAIPIKMSGRHSKDEFIIAVATFNRGFFLSSDGGKNFVSINSGMETIDGLIFGEDVVLADNAIYCLTAPYIGSNGWETSMLYKYNIATQENEKIDLGELCLVRSLTYTKEKGLYLNVIPTYKYQWFDEYNDGSFVNENGGIYHYEDGSFKLIFANTDGIFYSAFASDGKLYATDTYGKVFVIDEDGGKIFKDGLFTMLKNISFSLDGKILYVTTFGGGTYRIYL